MQAQAAGTRELARPQGPIAPSSRTPLKNLLPKEASPKNRCAVFFQESDICRAKPVSNNPKEAHVKAAFLIV